MFHFYTPWFALLIPIPYLIRKLRLPFEKNFEEKVPEIYFPSLERLKGVFPSSVSLKKQTPLFFLLTLSAVWFLLVFALMQPEKVDQFKQIKNEGYDLMLAVDISSSMQALDFSTGSKRVSRLDVVKSVVGKFALERSGDRVGLVTFGQHAYLHVPLTLDTLAVSRMLNDTVPGMAGSATAIGDAIGISIRVLRERKEGSRVLVLLTDGEDNSSSLPPLEAAKLAHQYGIRIYTVGVGKSGPVPFPNQFGGYGIVEVPMDESLLKEIAQMTGGKYFHASDQKALESIYQKINELEKTQADAQTFFVREPLYYYPLGAALFLLLVLSLYQVCFRRLCHGA